MSPRTHSRKKGSFYRRQRQAGMLFVLPGVLFFLVFFLYPIIRAFLISFTRWNIFDPMVFVGLDNYRQIFHDADTMHSFAVTGLYTVGFCVSIWVFSLLLALLLNSRIRFGQFFQTLFFIPSVLSITVVSIIWSYLFKELGLVNMLLRSLTGIRPIPWLTSSTYALSSVVISMVWYGTGYYMIIFLAGLRAIPESLLEAASIDGAGWWSTLFRVTLPLLKPTFLFVSVVTVIDSLQSFAPFYLMTNGGPGTSTRAITLKIYEDAFFRLNMGRATAASILLFVVMLAISLIQIRLYRSEEVY